MKEPILLSFRSESGAITLLEATFLTGLGLIFVLMAAGFSLTLSRASNRDKCAIETTINATELADPNFAASKSCNAEQQAK